MYVKGEFLGNIIKIEATEATIEIKPYAQYPNAVHVTFRKPRQRKDRGFVQSYRPSLLVLDGWGHPDPASPWKPISEGCSESKYMSCDERWQSDFDAAIEAYIETTGTLVLADFRNHDSYAPTKPTMSPEERKARVAALEAKIEEARKIV